jgi:tape measure domain-containing protein
LVADFRLEADVDVDASGAAKETQDAFATAIANAMKDPRVRAAVTNMVKHVLAEINKIPKSSSKAWDQTVRDANRAATKIAAAFKKVGDAAGKAARTPVKNPSITTLERSVAALADNLEESLRLTRQQIDLLVEMGRQERAAARLREQGNRTAQQELTALNARLNTQSQKQAAIIRQAGQIATATIRGFFRVTTQTMRSLTRVFEVTFRAAERAVRGFVHIAGNVLRGLGNTAAGIFRGMTRTAQAFGRTLSTIFSGLGRGIGRSLAGISRAIASALRRDEQAFRQSYSRRERDLSSSLGRQARAQARFNEQQRRGLLGGIGAGGLGAIAGGAGILGFLTSGFERASQQESLQLQFTTLLQDGDKAAKLLQQISDYARTTRFDFVEFAGSVAQLTGAFGDADRAFKTATFLSDIVSLTGGGTAQFAAARLAFSQIAASGRLEGDELRQLLEALPGVPIAKILADRFFGGDQAAFQEARRNGELGGRITSDAFFEALEDGAREAFPELDGFAQRVGQSLGGLADNLRENFAIFGAQVISLVEGPLKTAMGFLNRLLSGVGGFISGDIFDPTVVDLGGFVGIAQPEGLENLKELRDILGDVAKAIGIVVGGLGGLKLLRLTFIGLTSPLGLLMLGVSGIATLWNRMVDASARLRSTLEVLKNQIGPTIDAFKQFFGLLGGAIGRRLFGDGTGTDGGGGIFTKLGDGMRYAIKYIARGVVAVRHFVNTLSLLIAAGRADLIDDVIVGRFRDLNESLGEFLGNIFDIDQADIDAEGGGILGFLRNTFLEPIVNFFSVTVPEALGGVPSFVSSIIDAIFGGDEGGGPGSMFRGEEGGEGTIATRILNVLEDTILGPVVRFFRGPFADGIESAINFAVDVFRGLVNGIEAVWRFLEPILDPITDAFRDFFQTFREEGAGAAFGSLGRGLLDTLGNIGSLVGGLIGDIPGAIESAVGAAKPFIEEKLGPLWDSFKGWFADTFTLENLLSGGDFLLDLAYSIGNKIGEVLGDPAVGIAILAAIGGLGLTIGNFFLGIFTGLGENAGQWADLIADALRSAFGSIVPEDLGDNRVLQFAIAGALAAAIVGGVALAGKLAKVGGVGTPGGFSFGTLAFGIASGLASAIGREFSAIWRGGAFLLTGRRSLLTNAEGGNRVFEGVGQRIGGAILGGLAIAFAGYSIGQNVRGTGGLLLGLLTGTVTGASIGATAGGGIGAAIGAVLGGAIGLISTQFGQGAQKAEEMREQVALLADELRNLTGLDLQATLSANLGEAANQAGLGGLFGDADFSFSGLAQDIIEGGTTVRDQMAIFLSGLSDDAQAIGIPIDEFNAAFQNLFASGLPLDQFIANGLEGAEVFTKLGISADTAGGLIDYFTHQMELGGQALEDIGGTNAVEVIDTVAEAVRQLNQSFSPDGTGQVRATADAIVDMLSADDLTAQERIDAITEVAGQAKDAVDDAKAAILELLGVQLTPAKLPEIRADFTTQLPSIQNQWDSVLEQIEAGEITPRLGEDFKTNILADFRGDIESTLADAISAGLITSPADLTNFVDELRTGITDAGLGTELTAELLAQLDQIDPSAFAGLFLALTTGLQQQDLATEVINQLAAAGTEGGTTAAANFNAAFGDAIGGRAGVAFRLEEGRSTTAGGGVSGVGSDIAGSIGDAVSANSNAITDGINEAVAAAYGDTDTDTGSKEVGLSMTQKMGAGVAAGGGAVASATRSVVSIATSAAAGAASGMLSVGASIAQGMASGIRSQVQNVANAAAAIAHAAILAARSVLQSSSPSKVFQNIGQDIGKGFILGIKDTEGDMAAALDQAINTAMDRAQNTAKQRSADVAQTIFDALSPTYLPGGTSITDITSSLAGINQQILGFGASLGSGAGGAFGSATPIALVEATAAIQSMAREFIDQVRGRAEERLEARRAQAAGEALTRRQRELIGNLQNLDPATIIGAENRSDLAAALGTIRSFGEAALEAGQSVDTVIAQMLRYRDELIAQARAAGFSQQELADLVKDYGLSVSALAEYKATLLSLNITTAAGSANIAKINEQLLAIRGYASELLNAGASADQVAAAVRKLRDQLIRQATAFGFNAAQIAALIETAGLSDTALAAFIAQMRKFQEEAAGATDAAKKAAEEAARRKAEEEAAARGESTPTSGIPQPLVGTIEVNLPYGDPEAVALAVANRVAYDAVTSW